MPRYSAFAPFGMMAFSSRPTHAQAIYEGLRDSMGETYNTDPNSREQSRLYATAITLAASQYQLDRAANNRDPWTSTELIPQHEHDYQIVPEPNATLNERRAVLKARQRISRGARREAVTAALVDLLGDDFISYNVFSIAEAIVAPASPGDIGVFSPPGTTKNSFRVTAPISVIDTSITVPMELIGESRAPLAGETYCVDPDTRNPNIEKITLAAASMDTITATFSKPHVSGAIATRPHPVWISTKRQAVIVVMPSAAVNPETRRKINEQMERMARGVSQWSIIHNAGVLTSDDPVLGLPDYVGMS